MFRKTYGVVLLALIAASPLAAATNILTNGSFESGSAGWTVAGSPHFIAGSGDTATSPDPDPAGSNSVLFDNDFGTSSVSQTVALIAGHSYELGYDYRGASYQNAYPFTFSLVLGSQTIGTISSTNVPAGTWFNADYFTTAASTQNVTYSIQSTGGGSPAKDAFIDRAYMIDTTVPEPASWAMMIGGLGLAGAGLRRQRPEPRTA